MAAYRSRRVEKLCQGATDCGVSLPALPSFAFKPQHVVCADAVILAQRAQVADRQLVDAVFISGIDLLGGAEHARDRALLEVSILAQFAKYLPVLFHIKGLSCNQITRKVYLHQIWRIDIYTISGVK